jgi:hypothetical protein
MALQTPWQVVESIKGLLAIVGVAVGLNASNALDDAILAQCCHRRIHQG